MDLGTQLGAKLREIEPRQDKTGQDRARQVKTRQDKDRDKTRQDKTLVEKEREGCFCSGGGRGLPDY